ncbi:MAG: hypothetical protein WA747_09840 [Steroidobacteraceae bacterium]
MSRRTDLEARRQVLLLRCDQQRAELSQRFAQLRAGGLLGLPPLEATRARSVGDAAQHPLAWVIAIAGLLLLGRTREVLKVLVWARTALGVASRLAQIARFLVSLRPPPAREGHGKVRAQAAPEPEPPARSVS